MHIQKTIFLNGPPGSGKDTLADMLAEYRGYRIERFANPVRKAVIGTFGLDPKNENLAIDAFKSARIGTGSGRDWMIDYSEHFIKPRLGPNWFGLQCAERILRSKPQPIVISDAGFQDEVLACMQLLRQYPSNHVHYVFDIWHIERDGCSFESDSRNWVFVASIVPKIIENNGSKLDLWMRAERLL